MHILEYFYLVIDLHSRFKIELSRKIVNPVSWIKWNGDWSEQSITVDIIAKPVLFI